LCTLLFTCFVSFSLALFMFVLRFWWEFLQLLIVVGMHLIIIVYFWFLFSGVMLILSSFLLDHCCQSWIAENSGLFEFCYATFLLNSVSGNTCDLFKFQYNSNIISLFDNIVLEHCTGLVELGKVLRKRLMRVCKRCRFTMLWI
jgi:hypothetical protein